ncbi:MAG TPA: DinB family protein [Chitinophagaceae bacterium]|nr:DinB family protein [Chitinophagaceae bacterium]
MTKEEIRNKLQDRHHAFVNLIVSLNDHDFLFAPDRKWCAGQQLDHIYRSVSALNRGLALPKFIIKLFVGKANRSSKDYDALVAKYKSKLDAGGRATGRFVPRPVQPGQKMVLKEKLLKAVESLCHKIDRYNEKELDYYILPHPLLGKLTLREMLYFTIYHAEHHQNNALRNLEKTE